jgi:hypothetical protein
MAAKREQIILESVWPLAMKLERTYSLKAICSAGVLILSELTAEEREKMIERASIYPHSPEDIVDGSEVDSKATKEKRSLHTSKPAKSAG